MDIPIIKSSSIKPLSSMTSGLHHPVEAIHLLPELLVLGVHILVFFGWMSW